MESCVVCFVVTPTIRVLHANEWIKIRIVFSRPRPLDVSLPPSVLPCEPYVCSLTVPLYNPRTPNIIPQSIKRSPLLFNNYPYWPSKSKVAMKKLEHRYEPGSLNSGDLAEVLLY